jgi:hypothetical protein
MIPGNNISPFGGWASNTTTGVQDNFFNGAINTIDVAYDPLISGYAFIKWLSLPGWVEGNFSSTVPTYGNKNVSGNSANSLAPSDPGDYLFLNGFRALTQRTFLALSGLASIELATVAQNYGFANNEYQIAAGITKGNTEFTIRFQEYSGSPIRNSIAHWVSGIRDPETGVATYPQWTGTYGAAYHTGQLLYIMTRPDADLNQLQSGSLKATSQRNIIEFAALWTGVFPTRIPMDHLNYEQGTHDVATVEVPFKGVFHMSKNVNDLAYYWLGADAFYGFANQDMVPQVDPASGTIQYPGDATLINDAGNIVTTNSTYNPGNGMQVNSPTSSIGGSGATAFGG